MMFWICLMAVLVVGVLALRWMKHRAVTALLRSNFRKQFLHPEHVGSFREREAMHHAQYLEAAHTWTQEQIDEAVDQFVWQEPTANRSRVVAALTRSVGERTEARVYELLADPKNRERWMEPDPTGRVISPLFRAGELLPKGFKASHLSLLEPLLACEVLDVRRRAAQWIGSTGAMAALPQIQACLRDPERRIREGVIQGVIKAHRAGALDPELASVLIETLQALIINKSETENLGRLLYLLDEDAAMALAHTEEGLSPLSWASQELIMPTYMQPGRIDPDRLVRFIQDAENYPLGLKLRRNLSIALNVLGRNQRAEDGPLFERYLDHPNEALAEGAAEGYLNHLGVDLTFRTQDSTSEAYQQLMAIFYVETEVCNGGLAQYFYNPSGDAWQSAREGYRRFGFTVTAEIFERALKLFGAQGPAVDRELRQKQLARVLRRDEETFNEIEGDYESLKEPVFRTVAQFARTHPGVF